MQIWLLSIRHLTNCQAREPGRGVVVLDVVGGSGKRVGRFLVELETGGVCQLLSIVIRLQNILGSRTRPERG